VEIAKSASPNRPFSREAAEAAVCSAQQGLFWPMHQALLAAAPRMSQAVVDQAQATAGTDDVPFASCVAAGDARTTVDRDIAEARVQKLKSTPTFMFGAITGEGLFQPRATIAGNGTPEAFYRVIDGLLK